MFKLDDEFKKLLDKEIEVFANKNSEIYSKEWIERVLKHVESKNFPDVSEVTDNPFGQFFVTAFTSSDQLITLIEKRWTEFMQNPGTTVEETAQEYAKVVAFCEYASYIAKTMYENITQEVHNYVHELTQSVIVKEDPNAELN